ncbi:Threonine synthase and cysteate synthase [Halalkaliarchaeum sp. AArc-CO]|uniref:threonine synthase n=1 Tax=unclassified Halalkaliarchaeum TaxID=2678344 RepID=UPI00217DA417|nr:MULTISPECIES: threonine synthase [unclassified Halalkaliarchaeum]MDR5673513.1 threonine synthase [Halalkaliarchaeum sp. AArc-GB]UWG49801.1 Threonine synthase and cysteate synthase [Halalkaliarchaeum sp. AArc-CO]
MGLPHVRTLECTLCGARYEPDQVIYTCPEHDGVRGILEVRYDYARIRELFDADLDGNIPSQWKYRAFLPVDPDVSPVTLGEGGTPLLEAPRLGEELGVEIHIKDDGRNPTGVLKDRASSVAVTRARTAGRDVVTCASTGNAAASLSGYAARSGAECRIFVPGDTPEEKLAQALVYGADVLAVEGSYDEAYDLSMAVTDRYGWYNRNAAVNPFQVEGKRTVGHELAEQTRGNVPDWVVFAMGDGCTVAGGWKGFHEFCELGFVDEEPRLLGVQAEGASAIHDAFHGHDDTAAVAETVADSIAVGRPRNTVKACRALEKSDGTAVLVSDEEILAAEKLLGSVEGIYAEPAGAAPIAGIRKARGLGIVDPGDSVVAVVTGHGLKDAEAALEAGGEIESISPSIDDVAARYGE